MQPDVAREPGAGLTRWIFYVAAAWGVVTIVPLFFLEQAINRNDPPAITHPLFFYGFAGVALAWQLLFFVIARQPSRLRPVIPFAILEKLAFAISAIVLYNRGGVQKSDLWLGLLDLLWAALFLLCWLQLGKHSGLSARSR